MSSIANVPLSPPPIQQQLIDPNQKMDDAWSTWVNQVSLKISPNRSKQAIAAAGAVDLDAPYVSLTTTTAAYTITLAPPTIAGLYKIIEMIAFGSSHAVTMSLTNVIGGTASTTCTWNGTNQALLLFSLNSKWVIFKQQGVTLA